MLALICILGLASTYRAPSPHPATQDLLAAGISTSAAMLAGGWHSERMIRRYAQHLAAREAGMAQFARAQKNP